MPHRLAILLAALALTLSSTRSICAQPTTGQSTNDRQSSACTDPLPLADYLRLLRASHAAAIHGNQVGLAEVAPALVATTCVALNTDQSAPADNRWL
ncbi:MAG: hypothetical protein HGA65_09000, partial [Oscillochloris sp.]|nr:hypothetical protein [Oscillochloris sp.]